MNERILHGPPPQREASAPLARMGGLALARHPVNRTAVPLADDGALAYSASP